MFPDMTQIQLTEWSGFRGDEQRRVKSPQYRGRDEEQKLPRWFHRHTVAAKCSEHSFCERPGACWCSHLFCPSPGHFLFCPDYPQHARTLVLCLTALRQFLSIHFFLLANKPSSENSQRNSFKKWC